MNHKFAVTDINPDASVLNMAAYRFVALQHLPALRELLLNSAKSADLRGTILLAEEGINLYLAGEYQAAQTWLNQLQSPLGFGQGWQTLSTVVLAQEASPFAEMEVKTSVSNSIPFKKLLVKVKPEIIRMNQPSIAPVAGRAPAVDAATLKRWLDAGVDGAGRPVVMLDTRNAFEVDYGGFVNALDWRIAKFSDFTQALHERKDDLQGKTVVSYCTGGIRCEKAVLLMQQHGIENVYQLDGGILRYFEREGQAHYQGSCFVFDQREALEAQALQPSNRLQTAGVEQSHVSPIEN